VGKHKKVMQLILGKTRGTKETEKASTGRIVKKKVCQNVGKRRCKEEEKSKP